MPTTDPRVDAYIKRAQPFARPILTQFRKAVHAGCPRAVETIKWSFPSFDYEGPLASMAAFTAHCTFGFWKASLMQSLPKKRGAMGQFGRITSIDEMPDEKTLVAMVKEAAALNESGAKVVRAVKPKKPLNTPAFMAAALRADAKALANWKAFPPSHKREYIQWITEAKTDATRSRRLETALEWIARGKGRNWKYER